MTKEMISSDSFTALDGEASRDAVVAREKVQDLTDRVKKVEDIVLRSEGRLSSIETELAHLKDSNTEILKKLDALASRMDKQDGFFEGVKLTAKASAWVVGLAYGLVGGAIGYLLHHIRG